ncbi:RNA polymerase, sigma 28 subunit, SigD/FliA/WhiG [Candidatus Koribacter versatilis Ellin345]|uniref:RNA polymerase, sigma 28 subunit, SigD/FliA/WhiG n=1 Tax=Koribacter versatilis (strain Ellin345) TaxID=204669 RepID=Q1IR61_KORVE|nr:FliA/WhiG family RNA polymerase sigma factor [Candidatus Koribacter versatilis]ABF40639.1 RNA polymerase, sigma 28 subunit, SigD/FliA/WhiG [Candidatus Koribacter versatilis Ellin345]
MSGHRQDSGTEATGWEHRDRLVMEQMSQVKYIARRIHERLPRHVPIEDLINAGILGLIDAAGKYDSEKNVQFQSYAKFRIRGAILDSLRDLDWSPRDLRRKARALEAAELRLTSETGHPPLEDELARELGMDLDGFRELTRELEGLGISSLQEGLPAEGFGEEREVVVESHEESPLDAFLRSENHELLVEAIEQLPARERQVLALYYFEELTMKEVGDVLGVGESRVSQIHSQALTRVRARLQSRHTVPVTSVRMENSWISY